MNRLRALSVCLVAPILIVLLGALSACGGSSSSTPPPAGSYTLAASALSPASITAGATSSSTLTLTPANGYTGSVTLSCGTISGGSAAPTCSFSPNPVAISGTAAGTSALTVSTTTSTPGGSYNLSVTGKDSNNLAPSNGPQSLALTMTAVIQRVVVIFQENRTPDNLFQGLCISPYGSPSACGTGQNQYNIVSTGQSPSGPVPLSPIDLGTAGSSPDNYDLSHANSAFVAMYNGGAMNGINPSCGTGLSCPANGQYMYVIPSDVAPYLTMAQQYTFGDQMFQTNEGPSFPAHQFIFGGTSAPTATSTLFASENPNVGPAGCIGPPSTETVAMINAEGIESGSVGGPSAEYPCFTRNAMNYYLDAQNVTWRYYTPSAGSIWTAPDAIDGLCQAQTVNGTLTCTGPDWVNNVSIPEYQVLEDISNGQLAQVTWVIPDGLHSDHALSNNGSGPSWVASIVNAIGNSPYWANTAIIITWDDWGGWYDHVAPKVINDGVSWGSGYVYGFRVPLVVVSPYAKAKYISHVTHDFGSILNFIETTYGIPSGSLGYADAYADDLSDCFNLSQSPITFQTIPAPQGAAEFINSKHPPTDPDDD